jgi:hypothetical protein
MGGVKLDKARAVRRQTIARENNRIADRRAQAIEVLNGVAMATIAASKS